MYYSCDVCIEFTVRCRRIHWIAKSEFSLSLSLLNGGMLFINHKCWERKSVFVQTTQTQKFFALQKKTKKNDVSCRSSDRQIFNGYCEITVHLHVKWSDHYSTFAAHEKFRAVTNYVLFIYSDKFIHFALECDKLIRSAWTRLVSILYLSSVGFNCFRNAGLNRSVKMSESSFV